MDHNILKSIFLIGSPFGLCQNKFYKLFAIGFFLLYNVGIIVKFHARQNSSYWTLSSMQFVLRLLLNCDLYFHNFYVFIIVGITKRNQLTRLVTNIKKIKLGGLSQYHCVFFGWYITMVAVLSLNFYIWWTCFKFDFIRFYLIEYFEMYTQFFFILSACIILRMLLFRYKYQKQLILEESVMKQITSLNMHDIEINLVILKRTDSTFNEIFGWTILYNIFFAAIKTLIYLDIAVKNYSTLVTHSTSQFVSQITLLLLFWICIIVVIRFCDSIIEEFEGLISLAYRFENCDLDLIIDKNEICEFIKNVSQNRPKFTAGRYFVIEMTLIFNILDSMTTFLLIVLQFKEN
ncbi:gustatory receptor 43 [Tribolium castaneum]|uniref:Gustatory receptor n=1 Tax=Tribolium castaneum TaxID=7070 RepID=D2A4I2_TRICA|nr:gustatory receptor 43 [Tribolium castaneum]